MANNFIYLFFYKFGINYSLTKNYREESFAVFNIEY